ncbi:MAG: ribonuclease T2 [Rhodospirillaceae bacterium]
MKPTVRGLAVAALLALPSAGAAFALQPGQPGQFDYYVLSLSWSPEYCAGTGDRTQAPQCTAGRPFAFVLHGLWPQYGAGGWPQFCLRPAPAVPEPIIEKMLPIQPDRGLIQHEWARHGTCSGLDVARYFEASAAAFAGVAIPDRYQAPDHDLTTSVADLVAAFTAANPGLKAGDLSVHCKNQYLAELRLCLGRDLKPARCGADLRNQCGQSVVLRRVR